MKIELNVKELIELGDYISDNYPKILESKDLAKLFIGKLEELQKKKIIEISYLKISEVKFNTREKIYKINQNAVIKLMNEVLEKYLRRKPTKEDFEKVRISHEINNKHNRFVYFTEGQYLGQYMNIKDGEFFKLVFKFK